MMIGIKTVSEIDCFDVEFRRYLGVGLIFDVYADGREELLAMSGSLPVSSMNVTGVGSSSITPYVMIIL